MKKIRTNTAKGNEIAAKDILMPNGTVIIPKGTILKTEYLEKIEEIGITEIFVDNNDELISETDSITKELDKTTERLIQEQCVDSIRNTIDKYSYNVSSDLDGIAEAAETIIADVLSDPEVIYQVSGIRDKSESTYLHSINVTALSVLIASKLKLNTTRVRDIAVGALLHDIGMVFLPAEYRHEEYDGSEKQAEEIKKHVITGYSVVEDKKWISPTAKQIILMHHEYCDGLGYPMGLKADKLKLESKIVTICDVFDNMVYGNFTKKKKVYEVIEYIMGEAGNKFDLKAVGAFVSSVAAYPIGSFVVTNEGEVGIVIRQNKKMPTRPVIRILLDSNGNKYSDNVEKDLTKELTLFIKDTIEM